MFCLYLLVANLRVLYKEEYCLFSLVRIYVIASINFILKHITFFVNIKLHLQGFVH